ncbi:MAG: 23S rRNA (adenine(2503)-C(2))-methyltransferase RlmN [Pseudomonadota bacterium]|nr:23S rRNA (adenine(2503)-C(2))-methyltransferase RlmN [Pseudomonadota bacterium]
MSPSPDLNPEQFASADGQRVNLIGIPRAQLNDMLVERGHKPFRTKQLWQWLYWHGVTDFDAMTNLSKDFRQKLADEFIIERPQVSEALNSVDGTAKWLLKFPDGKEVETVHIPEADRGTLCVSSQVGCTLTCKFCHTGTQKLVRNLTAAEVVGQMMLARDAFGEWPTPSDHSRMITNVVMMGMGEPLYNYDNVAAALRIVMDGEGLSLSKRRITLSTSGVVPAMRKCGEELNVNLAVSLHAVDDDTRDHIMPINKKYPLEELLDACRTYPGVTNARRITFEYVMLKGVNDNDADARQLVRLLKGIPSKINLIPFNPWPGSDFECSSATRIAAFQTIIQDAGLSAPVRTTRGEDILAACGQLKSESQKLRRSERDRLAAAHLAAQVAAVD